MQSCLGREALRKGRNVAVRQIELHALNAMHRKEDYTESGGIARFYHRDEIFERTQFDAGKTDALMAEGKNRTPELLPGVTQRQ